MAMARALCQSFKRFSRLDHLHRSFSRQARTRKAGEETPKKRKAVVPTMAERCKSILGLNWRGQLTTLKPRLADKEEREKADKTFGEFSNYILYDDKVIVYVPEESQHCPNLLLDSRASLIIGHTDPSPLMKVFQQVKKIPPHTLLVGTLIVPEDADKLSQEVLKDVIKEELSELEQIAHQSSPSIKPILESGGHVLQSRVRALNQMFECRKDDTFYHFDANSCHYVDMSGIKHLVEAEVLKKAARAMSPLLPVVIEGINRNQKRRMGLKVLCAWFLHVKVKDAFALSADKWGLDVFAKVVSDSAGELGDGHKKTSGGKNLAASGESEWKIIRLTFREEVLNINEFCAMLGQMEKECVIAMGLGTTRSAPEKEYAEK
ncbi:hypothetical protein L7F22_017009 [Adiantum nelumboides]|nr:hypothetical protein [Adiantum nelumboides]